MTPVDAKCLVRFAGWSALLMLGAMSLTSVVHKATQIWLPDLPMGLASLMQLSFGVQVLLAWMAGWLSVLVVLPAMLVYSWWTLPPETFDAALVARIAASSVAVPAVLAGLRRMGVKIDPSRGDGRAWARLILAGLLAALVIQLARYHMDCCGAMTLATQLRGMALSMAGQVLGLWVALIALILWFRLERRVAI